MRRSPAIVACCSKAGLAVIRALGARRIPIIGLAYGSGQIGLSSRFVRAKVRCPDPAEDEAAFIAQLTSHAERWHGAVVFPTDDASLVALSRHKELLSGNYRIVAERWELVRSLIEKRRTYEIARAAGIPCPNLQVVRGAKEAYAYAREIGFPCLLKPSVGHLFFKKFGAKMLMAHSMKELLRSLDILGDYDGELMLSEFIPGPDTCGANYNSFCVSGQPVQEFTAQKIRLKPSLIGFPTAVQSKHMPEVLEVGRKMVAALGINGFSCMELKRDIRDGVYKLMEVNGRHNYSGRLAAMCGIDFPYMSYLAARGAGLPLPVHAARIPEMFWIDEERDIRGALTSLRDLHAARSYLEPYRARKVYAVLSFADFMPSVSMACSSLKLALHRGRHSTVQSEDNIFLTHGGGRQHGCDLGTHGKGGFSRP